jgi:hypothetical protein
MMATSPKPPIEHRDRLGRLLKVGDCVAYPSSNTLVIGTIKKLNPKMIGVNKVGVKGRGPSNKYPSDLVLLDGPEVTMYLIKNSS